MEASAILLLISVLLFSLFILVAAGNYFVDAAIRYARKIGVSKYFVGLLVVAVATSSPDIATSISGLVAGNPDIMSGVVMGGLMIDLALLNGIFGVIGKRLKLETESMKGREYMVLGFLLFPFIFMLTGHISRIGGALMVLSFLIYIVIMWRREAKSGHLKKQVAIKIIWQDVVVFLLAMGSLLLAGRWAVWSVVHLSTAFAIPVFLLSMTVLAIATALPDATAGIMAIVKGKGGEVGVGESIGSTLIEINLFTGLAAIIRPIQFDVFSTLTGIAGLVVTAVFLFSVLRTGVLKRWHGIVLIGIYVLYVIAESIRILWFH